MNQNTESLTTSPAYMGDTQQSLPPVIYDRIVTSEAYSVLARYVVADFEQPGVYQYQEVLHRAFGARKPLLVESASLLISLSQLDEVLCADENALPVFKINPEPESEAGKRFISMERDVDELVRFLGTHYPGQNLDWKTVYEAADAMKWRPTNKDDHNLFHHLAMSHPRRRSHQGRFGRVTHTEHPQRSLSLDIFCQDPDLSVQDRLELLCATRRRPKCYSMRGIARKLGFQEAKEYRSADFKTAVANSRLKKISGYELWEIVPEGSTRECLDVARRYAEAIVEVLQDQLVPRYKVGTSLTFHSEITEPCLKQALELGLPYEDMGLFCEYIRWHPLWPAVFKGKGWNAQEALEEAVYQQTRQDLGVVGMTPLRRKVVDANGRSASYFQGSRSKKRLPEDGLPMGMDTQSLPETGKGQI